MANPTMTRRLKVHLTKAHRLREDTNSDAYVTSLKHASTHQTLYTYSSTASWWCAASHGNDYSHTRLYKGNLTSPPRYDSLFPHFSHVPSHFSYLLEHWSANVPTNIFYPTAKTHHHRTKALSITVVSINSSPDRSIFNTLYCIMYV